MMTLFRRKIYQTQIGKAWDVWKGAKGITPECFPFVHNEAWLQVFKKYNITIPGST